MNGTRDYKRESRVGEASKRVGLNIYRERGGEEVQDGRKTRAG
jgi:hypothetical protein